MKVARKLILYEAYSRQDVYDIFEGSARSMTIDGAWSLWPVLQVTIKLNNFVFFVTLDQEQVGHPIAEWVTEKGMFTWQSQPQKSLADWQIKQLIHHDANKNDIYLFLRTDTTSLYTYLGRLAYHKHKPEQERPVVIQWQILDWNPPPGLFRSLGLALHSYNSIPLPQATSTSPSEKPIMARSLILYEDYSRRNVYDLFETGTRFTPQAGTWGLLGIVPILGKPGNFALFVTFGKEQSGYHFDEWISKNGTFNWQSQPHQSLADQQIQQFIHHNPAINDIYLFLRTGKTSLYTYLGRLAYSSHDLKREQPVYIKWQILDWNPPPGLLQSMALNLLIDEPQPQPPPQPINQESFEWRGVQYPVDRVELQNKIRKQVRAGLPIEATRYRDWFVYIGGERLSPKWVIHLITGADYSEFDAPTARDKLEKLGIKSYQIIQSSQLKLDGLPKANISDDGDNNHQIKEGKAEYIKASIPTSPKIQIPKPKQPLLVSLPQENTSPDEDEKPKLPESKMSYKRKYISSTIDRLTKLILDLAQLGEIESISRYGLGDNHLVQLVESGWATLTPYSIVVTPHLLNVLPLENKDMLYNLLHLYRYDLNGWGNYEQKAFNLSCELRFEKLGYDYIYTPKPNSIADDKVWRPAWLVNYMPEIDWEDWEVSDLMQSDACRRDSKLFVHSTLPIRNIFGSIPEVQEAAWKTAFYWLMLQLLILSDPETGAVYDPHISLTLSDGWRDGSIARLFLQKDYVGDITDKLEALLSPFKWVWVNRSHDGNQDQQAVLGLLRLLLKIDVAKLGTDGCLQFTDSYRNQLFQSQAKAQFYYRSSKEARDKLRDTIKEMGR